MVIDMGHNMLGQYGSIERTEQACMADLHGITEVLWKMTEESIELVDKVFGRQPVALELKQEGSRMRLEPRLTIGGEDEIVKEFRIEKTWIRLSGSDAIP